VTRNDDDDDNNNDDNNNNNNNNNNHQMQVLLYGERNHQNKKELKMTLGDEEQLSVVKRSVDRSVGVNEGSGCVGALIPFESYVANCG
jgi:hypothetical protein